MRIHALFLCIMVCVCVIISPGLCLLIHNERSTINYKTNRSEGETPCIHHAFMVKLRGVVDGSVDVTISVGHRWAPTLARPEVLRSDDGMCLRPLSVTEQGSKGPLQILGALVGDHQNLSFNPTSLKVALQKHEVAAIKILGPNNSNCSNEETERYSLQL